MAPLGRLREPITAGCQARALGLTDRLALFEQVAAAARAHGLLVTPQHAAPEQLAGGLVAC